MKALYIKARSVFDIFGYLRLSEVKPKSTTDTLPT
jgi:hypothetical protein